jgi:hypothetical protein
MANPGVKENEFRSWVNIQLKSKNWFTTNIETSTRAGVPDMYVVADIRGGLPFWLELKCGLTDQPLIRKEQRVWGYRHHRHGGKSYYLYNNYSTGRLSLYRNPVQDVKPSGRLLKLMDPPLITINPWDLCQELEKILI